MKLIFRIRSRCHENGDHPHEILSIFPILVALQRGHGPFAGQKTLQGLFDFDAIDAARMSAPKLMVGNLSQWFSFVSHHCFQDFGESIGLKSEEFFGVFRCQ
jgi:hypothetical protein